MKHYKPWSVADEKLIETAAKPIDVKWLADTLNRTESAVRNRAFQLGVSTACERMRHKGNNPVKQCHIDEAVTLFKKHGSGAAAASESGISYGRICYLLKLARYYGDLPPTRASIGSLNETQKMVYDWISKNPQQKAITCIQHFRRQGFNYYSIQNAHEQLRKKRMISRDGLLWCVS